MNAPEIMLAAAAALDRTGIPAMLVGSFASNQYGIPRSTQDADFLLQIPDLSVAQLAQALGPEFQLDPQLSLETITLGTHYVIRHRDSDFTVDLFLIRADPHEQLALRRQKSVTINGHPLFVPTPEDVIITKLRWSKGGRRSKDIDDVRGVLAVQTPAALDLPYLRHWTTLHSTRDLFEQLLADTPIT